MPTALLSVYHKEGIVEFAKQLTKLGWDLIASGGTCKVIQEAGIVCRDVAEITGMPPILDHRVVTLHPKIHGGVLAKDTPEHSAELEANGIPRIDLVCIDLYPLEDEIAKPNSTYNSVIEMTDIGGPTLLRAAAKGGRIVICDPGDRNRVLKTLIEEGLVKSDEIAWLAAKAEAIVTRYCLVSVRYRSHGVFDGMIGNLVMECKYGENAWQTQAGLYSRGYDDPLALDKFKCVAGTEPSYNNLCDLDRMLQTITHIAAAWDINRGNVPCIAIAVKHGNPCGAAVREDESHALQKMIEGDERAIFGGLVMANFEINVERAENLLRYHMDDGVKRLLDGVVAPSFTEGAIDMLSRKGGKCRLLANPALTNLGKENLDRATRFRYVRGGFLSQPNYGYVLDLHDPDLVTYTRSPFIPDFYWDNFLLGWAICATSNSNTITIVRDTKLLGNGVGQQDRVGAAKLAVMRANEAGHEVRGAAAVSDSFFPFTDGPAYLANAGISAILATSGSIRDDEVIKCCQKLGATLWLMPDTKARGFFGH